MAEKAWRCGTLDRFKNELLFWIKCHSRWTTYFL